VVAEVEIHVNVFLGQQPIEIIRHRPRLCARSAQEFLVVLAHRNENRFLMGNVGERVVIDDIAIESENEDKLRTTKNQGARLRGMLEKQSSREIDLLVVALYD